MTSSVGNNEKILHFAEVFKQACKIIYYRSFTSLRCVANDKSVDNWYSIAKDASLRFAAFRMTGAIGGVWGSEEAHFAEKLFLKMY